MDTTGKGLADHWNWAASKGLMNRNSARALGAACSQVLGALDNWETIDVTTLNVEDVLHRFKNLRAKDFTPGSLASYESRFKKALKSYLAYARDPGAWKYTSQPRPVWTAPKNETKGGEAQPPETPMRNPPESTRGALVDYPFPLREGLTVRLMLPRDIKMTEVKRLNAFMATLTVDFGEGGS